MGKTLLIVGLLGLLGLTFILPVAQVSFDEGETYAHTPLGLYIFNQFTDECSGYPDIGNHNQKADKCEFKEIQIP